jgi:AhpD family alkylhydroperoxidase
MTRTATPERIPPLGTEDVDPATASMLRSREKKWGKSWNITHTLASAPAVLAMMNSLWDCLEQSTLSVADRELIAMEMAVSNGCHYCVPAHRYVAQREAKLEPAQLQMLEAVSRGEELRSGTRLATMQRLVRLMIARRGGLTDDEFSEFRSQGVTPQQMIETIAEIAHCTVTNYTNRLARTPLDDFLEPYR